MGCSKVPFVLSLKLPGEKKPCQALDCDLLEFLVSLLEFGVSLSAYTVQSCLVDTHEIRASTVVWTLHSVPNVFYVY